MKINKIINFLRSQEKYLSGKVTTASVDLTLWGNKADFAYNTLLEFTQYLDALNNIKNKEDKKFSEYLSEIKANAPSVDKSMQNVSSESLPPWWLDEEIHIEVLKLMIQDNYELPEENSIVNFTGTQIHLNVFWAYLKYMSLQKYFFPEVNEKITYAGMVLIQSCDMFIAAISTKGKAKDNSSGGVASRRQLEMKNEKSIESLLIKYNISDLKIFRKEKTLRKSFMEDCERATAANDEKHHFSLSQDRILRIARKKL